MTDFAPPSELEHYREQPRASLSPFVDGLLSTRSRRDGLAHRLPVPPSGRQYLTYVDGAPIDFYFDNQALGNAPSLFIGGQLKRRLPVALVRGAVSVSGVAFSPCGFYRLFHRPCSPLADAITPFDQAVGLNTDALCRQLNRAESTRQKFDVLQDFLEPLALKALPEGPADWAVALIDEAEGQINVESVARELGLGERQLNRHFLRAVGVSPKHFAKVVQIRSVVEVLDRNDPGEIADLAYRAGYYDQAHFTHDFQRLVGYSPLGFLNSDDPFLSVYLRSF